MDAEIDSVEALGFEETFERYEAEIGRFLASVVRSRTLADDLLQETFLAALRDWGRAPGPESRRAWLYGIARHRALDALRSRRRRRALAERWARAERAADGRSPDVAEAVAVRDLLVRHLPAEDRTLLVLRYVHGLSSEELAAIDGRSPEAVRQRLSRARRRLLEAAREGGSR